MPSPSAFRSILAVGCTLAALALASCSADSADPATTSGQTTSVQSTTTTAQTSSESSTSQTSSSQTSSSETSGSTDASTTASPAAGAVLALKMADNPLGSILVDGAGMTLYMFTKDSANTSACEGQCLVAWPPLIGVPTEGAGVDDSKLGSFTRDDGRVQATYNGWPLYYWMNDAKPGDATGQKVQGVWFVLDRDGEPIK